MELQNVLIYKIKTLLNYSNSAIQTYVFRIDPNFESHQCLLTGFVEENDSAAMLAARILAGDTPEVNLQGKCNMYASAKCE